MAFCKYCGKELAEGTGCDCPEALAASAPQQPQAEIQPQQAAPEVNPAAQPQNGQAINLSKPQTEGFTAPQPQQTEPQQTNFAAQPQQPQQGQPDMMMNNGAAPNNGFAQPAPAPAPKAPLTAKQIQAKKNLIMIGGGLGLLILLLILICLIAGGSYKTPIKNYVKSINKIDGELYCETIYTEDMLEDKADRYDYDVDEYCDEISDSIDDYYDYLEDEFGKNPKISVKFEDARELSKIRLAAYEYYYDEDITKGYKVDCKLTYKGRDDDDTDNVDFYVFKVKGEGWKLYPEGDVKTFSVR